MEPLQIIVLVGLHVADMKSVQKIIMEAKMSDWIPDLVYSLTVGCIASVSVVLALGFGLASLFDTPIEEQPEPEPVDEGEWVTFADYDVLEEAEQFLQELHNKQEEEKS